MFKNYLVTAWRNIIKNGLFSLINIFGLAVGLMSCILIMLFVREESGFDQWLPDNDRLVRMHSSYSMPNQEPFSTVRSAGRMMEAIRDYATNEVETGVRLIQWGMTVRQNADVFSEQMTMADGSFFDVFALEFVHGSKAQSFAKPLDTVVTEAIAVKYFGKTDVVGETLTLCCVTEQPSDLTITGVIKDLPDATHFDLNIIIRLQPLLFGENNGVLDTWTSLNVYTYFKMNEGVSVSQFQTRIDYWLNNESPLKSMMKDFLGDLANNKQVTDIAHQHLMLVPDLHLHAKEDAGNMGDFTPMGDSKMINTFVIVAILVLLIACVNFMNLATAKGSKRAREVAMRKVLGATRFQVAIQFLSEAIALVLLSLLVALVLVELVLPIYNSLLGRALEFELLNEPQLLLSLVGVALIVGLGAGLYPALYLSRFMPGHILKASKSTDSGNSAKLRNVLVIGQFATSIALVISTLVVYGQTIYSNAIDVGYKSDDKLVLNIRGAGDGLASLKQELLNLPEVTSVSFSSEAPTQDNENNHYFKLLEAHDGGNANEKIVFNYHNMDYGFFEAYGVKPIAGRLFDPAFGSDPLKTNSEEDTVGSASVIINSSALKKLGFNNAEQALGKTLETPVGGNQHLTIVGVIPDVYFRSIKFGIRPSVYMLNESRFRAASIAFNTDDVALLVSKIEDIWQKNVPMHPINIEFLSEMMSAQYASEETTARLFLAFSVLAILIACLGLYGLSAFTVERRTKEIGIRKVMGAGIKDIVALLIWQFSKPVIIANAIAWPIAVYAMITWLEAYPYRIEFWWLLPICLAVGTLSIAIAWITVGGNAARVARKNPITSLRYE